MTEDQKKTLNMITALGNKTGKSIPEDGVPLAEKIEYNYDPSKTEPHQETLQKLKSVVAQIDPKDVADAFLYSLSTRNLEYRSALGSYYYAKAIPAHTLMPGRDVAPEAASYCYFCGWDMWKTVPGRYEIFGGSYEKRRREKGFGGSSSDVNYMLYDLEQFLRLPKVTPSQEDRQMFTNILSCVGRLKSSDKAGALRNEIIKAKILKSNRLEVMGLLDELGICGILAGKEYPPYDVRFANLYERAPAESKNDFAYPVNRWRAEDGINTEKLKEVFGDTFSLTE